MVTTPRRLAPTRPSSPCGHLNSIQLTDFILFVEELSSRPLALDQLDPDNFVNVNAVCAAFFGDTT